MPAPTPLISVIIVCRNPGPRLRTALASVWAQQKANYEIVVIDGSSTDGTREWLETQRPRIAALISEPDGGIYDAMNKGIANARGAWIQFLGADDRLANNEVLARVSELLADRNPSVAAGEARYDDGRIYQPARASRVVRRNFVHHQATFYRRSLLTEIQGFDRRFRIMADYDMNLKLWKREISFEPLPWQIAECGSGGLSDFGAWAGYREEIAIRHQYFPSWRCWPWDLVSIGRFLRKKMIRRHSKVSPTPVP